VNPTDAISFMVIIIHQLYCRVYNHVGSITACNFIKEISKNNFLSMLKYDTRKQEQNAGFWIAQSKKYFMKC
jgi:hypothetical protein